MEIIEYSHIGSRECNQDYTIHKALSTYSAIIVVADGMGGYSQGEVASKLVAESIVEYVATNIEKEKPAALLRQSMLYANESLMLKRIAQGGTKMGTVVAVLLIIKNNAYISWLGDSRVYLYRDGEMIYQTEDHSVACEMSKLKTINIGADTLDRYSHIVTKAIMGDDKIGDIPVSMAETASGDVFVLCSDGFHKESDITTAVRFTEEQREDMDKVAETLSDNNSFIKVVV